MSRFHIFHFSLFRALLVSAGMSLLPGLAFGAEAGKVVFVVGTVQVAAKPALVDQSVGEGDELVTGADGYIYMKTVDDGFLILRPNSRARVVAYRIDKANPANTQVKLELLKGVARSISGDGVKRARNNFRFNTPVAAIGVRGTDFIVYTTDQSSWVSVVSGGVVMSGFAGGCGREGTGPCEGVSSRELFAGRTDAMLQVQRGEQAPQLLQGATVAPEVNAPPRSDEPVGKLNGGPKLGAAPLTEVNLDPSKAINQIKPGDSANPAPVPNDPVPDLVLPDPVVIVPDPVVVNPPPVIKSEVMWGRWEKVAEQGVDSAMLEKINAEGKKARVILGSYVIARPDNSAFVLPREGTASFKLVDSEAVLGRAGGPMLSAQVENAKLNMDFAARSYSTGLSVVNSIGRMDLSSKGDILQNGTMQNSFLSQGMVLRGVLGGTNAAEAIYSFKSTSDPLLSSSGITKWSRD